ncbi:MAG: cupin domain-containing protein [Steroidobacteraceae bacterium]
MSPLNIFAITVVLSSTILTAACSSLAPNDEHVARVAPNSVPARREALILREGEGERLIHRPPPGSLSNLTAPLILKVDRRNGGAPEFVMLTEDIPPGQTIPLHRHPHSDEIIFIHAGTGLASLGGREATVTAGATIYMPRNTVVGLRNIGTEPLKIAAFFSQPGYEEYLRAITVPEGQVPTPLTVEELSAIRARHLESAVYEQPK